MGLTSNSSTITEENMVKGKYIILTACFLFGMLMITMPVAAAPSYSVSVSPYGFGSFSSSLSPEKLAVVQGYSTGITPLSAYSGLSTQKLTAISEAQTAAGTGAQGSVSAFSSYSSRTPTSSMDFSQSVSVQGAIYTFEFTASFI
jgi:hypothetical protein